MKKGLLVVSFGSSYSDAVQENIIPVENALKQAFPGYEFRRAFGSKFIIRKILKRDGIKVDTVEEALLSMKEEGFAEVIVQPTYFIPGTEYTELQATVAKCHGLFGTLKLGMPLLNHYSDFETVMHGMQQTFPLKSDEALVLMGHGTDHFANTAYPTMEHMITMRSEAKIFMGTVEGYPELKDVQKNLKASGVRKVILTAFMLVAGDHAKNDMAGEEEDSWKSILENEGYEVSCILKGFGSYSFIQELFVDHARKAAEM